MRRVLLLTLAAAGLAGAHQDPTKTILISGGTVVDGTGGVARRADVRLRGDTIAEIAATLPPLADERVIDAAGQTVAPGFIDMHSHADRGIGEHPDASSQVLQGITTAVVGQDGGGTMPVSDFFAEIESSRPAINFATMVGHGTVRGLVLGADYRRKATSAEIETMKALVDRGMRDGALGLSSGLEYDPGFYAETNEVVELARVAGRYGGLYASHVRDEENSVLDAWREAIEVGRQAGVAVEISHVKLASKPVWGKAAEGLGLLERARRDRLTVMADWYPYTYWQSSLYVLIPDRDFDNRRKWEVGLEEIGGPQNVLVTNYRPDSSFNGRTIAEIAASSGKDPISLIIEMIHGGGPGIGIIVTAMTETDLEKLFAHPQVLVCSDGGLTGRHPRGYGTFPRVLGKYVRDRKLVTLPEAIAKMTGRSAQQLGLSDRGVLAAGKKADVVVFDATAIQDAGTPQQPSQPPAGVKTVILNGEPVLLNGVMTSARPGRGLRRESTSAASAVRR
jgi:N-acyl-D-amino-acid deacylase